MASSGIAGDLSKELLDFRVNDGSLLFGPGMTDRFFASLGGFDLDDKVLTKMMTYKDSKDVKRLLFGIYRQPSGPEESIYARANLDEGTLRSYFQNRRFEGLLNDYRVSAGPQDAYSQTVIDDFYNVVWNKQNFTNNIDSEKAERLVIEIFDFAQSEGKAGLRELDGTLEGVSGAHNRRILRSIERQGASSLANNEQYTRPGLFKLLVQDGGINKEEGALVREELKNLLKNDEYKNVLETGLYNRLNEAVNDSRYGDIQRIFDDNFDNPYLKGLKEQAVFDKMFNVVDKAETYQLGSYVNRSMLVGSRLNQTQDLIEEIAKSAFVASAEERVILEGRIKKIVQYQVGLVAQEAAIDYGTSSSGVMPKLMNDIDLGKKLLTETAEVYRYVTDASSALKTIQRLTASGGTLQAIGEDAVSTMGQQMGSQYVQVMEMAKTFSPEKAQKFKDLYLPKLDQQLLMGRSSDQDIARIIEGISSGISEQATNKEDFKGILYELSDESLNATDGKGGRRNALIRIFGADATHTYATLSKHHGVGTIIAANAETMNNILMRRPTIDPSLASFEYTENAKKTSDYLLKKHSDQISRIANLTADASLLNDTDKFNLSMSKFFMADQVTAEIREAANLSGVSVQEMINTLKKRSYETNIRNMYDDLQYFPDGFDVQDGDPVENFRKLMNAADVNRRRKYFNKFYGGNMEYGQDASGALKMLKEDGTIKSVDLATKAKSILAPALENIEEYNRLLNLNGTAAVDLLALLSEDDDTISNIFKLGDSKKARGTLANAMEAVRTDLRYEELDDDLKSGSGFASTSTVDPGEPTTDIGRDLKRVINDEDPSVAKSQFKRMSEFIKDGSLKNLFEQNKLFKNSVVAAGALIVGSFAYDRMRDRTSDDIQGPPLLPGGSSYENDYPRRFSEVPQIGRMNYNPNIDYKVNLYGSSKDVSSFREQAMGLGKFNMNTTMYRRAPQLGMDPYREVASSF